MDESFATVAYLAAKFLDTLSLAHCWPLLSVEPAVIALQLALMSSLWLYRLCKWHGPVTNYWVEDMDIIVALI